MATLKDLRTRIDSVTQTQKITSAMKMVAASKLRRAQEAAESARPYAERMERMVGSLAEIMRERDDAPKMLRGSGADSNHLIVVASSNRGLCGGFNSTITRAVRLRIMELRNDGKTVKLFCVGRKGRELLQREFGSLIIETSEETDKRGPGYDEADTIGQKNHGPVRNWRIRCLHHRLQSFQISDDPARDVPADHSVRRFGTCG
jgi:F-type H+-transporting ATPase subunit gamma